MLPLTVRHTMNSIDFVVDAMCEMPVTGMKFGFADRQRILRAARPPWQWGSRNGLRRPLTCCKQTRSGEVCCGACLCAFGCNLGSTGLVQEVHTACTKAACKASSEASSKVFSRVGAGARPGPVARSAAQRVAQVERAAQPTTQLELVAEAASQPSAQAQPVG